MAGVQIKKKGRGTKNMYLNTWSNVKNYFNLYKIHDINKLPWF